MVIWSIEPLSKGHDRSHFSSGEEALDLFLKTQARQQQDKGFSRSYAAISPDGRVLGFYSLSAGHVSMDLLSQEDRARFPYYEAIPAILLGRLAVDLSMQGKGLGVALFGHAAGQAIAMSKIVGVVLMAVDAKNDSVKEFYTRLGFKPLEGDPLRMFVPIKTLIAGFEVG
jgi:GNAT superfamily N-acetyltransferase